MTRRHPFRLFAEYLLACLFRFTIPWLPRPCVVALARGMGALAFRLSRRQRRVALANLLAVYGTELTERQRIRIAQEAFLTISLMGLDFFWFSIRSASRMRKYIRFDSDIKRPAGARICVTAHLGNWELLGHVYALHYGPLTSVAATLRNPYVDRMVSRVRQVTGHKMAAQRGAVRSLLKVLRGGGEVALLIDQNTVPAEGGVFVDFFGLPVPTSKAIGALRLRTGADVLFAYCIPDEHGVYTVYSRPLPDEFEGSGTQEGVTQGVARLMEDAIREHPGKWMWMYKRWKFIPEGRSPEGYPSYARTVEPQEL